MSKRVLTLFVIISITVIFIPAIASIGDELLSNTGFETMSAAYQPTDWLASLAYWENNPGVSVDTQNARSGARCIKLDTTKGANTAYVWYLLQNKTGSQPIVAGDKYKFTAWFKADPATPKSKAQLSASYTYTDKGAAKSIQYTSTNGIWVQMEDIFTVPVGVKRVDLSIKILSSDSIIYVDDVSCVKIEEEPRAKLETDEIFYYPDKNEGTATVKMSSRYSDYAGGTVQFFLKDGDTILLSGNPISVSDELIFNYSLKYLSQMKKEYKISAVIKNSSGTVLETQTRSVYKYERPGILNEDGLFLVDGKPFSMVGAMGTEYPDSYEYLKSCGINTVFCAPHRLDEAQRYGLKAVVFLYGDMTPPGHPDKKDTIAATIEAYKDHPALLAWNIMDEPFGNFSDPDKWLIDSYTMIRNIDDTHAIWITEEPFDRSFDKAAKYCDVLAVDPYPRELYPVTTYVSDTINRAVTAVRNDKPVYSVIQTFEWGGYFPTLTDFRNMYYQSFLGGAKGIIYYKYREAIGSTNLDKTAIWPGILDVHSTESQSIFDSFVMKKYPVISQGDNDLFRYRAWRRDGQVYIMVLNLSDSEQSVTVPVFGITDGTILKAVKSCSTAGLTASENSISLTLAGRDVALIKSDENYLENSTFDAGKSNWYLSSTSQVLLNEGENNYFTISSRVSKQYLKQTAYKLKPNYYVLSFKAKSSTGQAAYNVYAGGKEYSGSVTDNWIKYEIVFSVPSGGDQDIRLYGNVGEVISYDDITLTPLKEESDFSFYSGDTEITDIRAGNITIKCRLRLNSTRNIRYFAAVYKEYGGNRELTGITPMTIENVAIGVNSEISESIYVPDTKCRLKFFIWEENELQPLFNTEL